MTDIGCQKHYETEEESSTNVNEKLYDLTVHTLWSNSNDKE